ncbi:MAG: zinc metallopeptidase [Candidatus Eremiobacterota bacterium]
MFIFGDWTFLILIPALLFSIYASIKVKSAFNEFSKTGTFSGITGAQIARELLWRNGLSCIPVEMTDSYMGDHYDPAGKVLRLSPDVYRGNSITSLGVAAHEVGHAVQHKEGYVPLALRSSLVPVANLGTYAAFPLFFAGFLFSSAFMVNIGIYLFLGAVLFYLITLPVEFNASRRALAMLQNGQFMTVTEMEGAKHVLHAAAMTYIAALFMAVSELLRMIILKESLDNR